MREEIRKEERVVVNEYKKYIAEDGKEFDTKRECQNYELDLAIEKAEEKTKQFIIDVDITPLTLYDDFRECDTKWYKVNSIDDLETVKEYYSLKSGDEYGYNVYSFPAIVCIADYDDYYDVYTLENIMKQTEGFFDKFNIKINFEGR